MERSQEMAKLIRNEFSMIIVSGKLGNNIFKMRRENEKYRT